MEKDNRDKGFSEYNPHKEESRERSIEREESRHNTLHTLHTLHSNKERRSNISIRMRKSIHETAMKYCALTNMTAGELYEESVILFMDINPPPVMRLNVIKQNHEPNSLKDKMLNAICVEDMQGVIPNLRRRHRENLDIPKSQLKYLMKLFEKCRKVEKPTKELNNLIEEALDYLPWLNES